MLIPAKLHTIKRRPFYEQKGHAGAKDNLGFGMRRWRYATLRAVVKEEGFSGNWEIDPHSSP